MASRLTVADDRTNQIPWHRTSNQLQYRIETRRTQFDRRNALREKRRRGFRVKFLGKKRNTCSRMSSLQFFQSRNHAASSDNVTQHKAWKILLFPETRPTLVVTPSDPKKNYGLYIRTELNVSGSISIVDGCFLVMHHVRIIFPLK